MDLLSQRYASPFLLLDEFIHLEQLHDFFLEITDVMYQEKVEKYRWEYYLHKVFDKSYDDYIKSITSEEQESQSMDKDEIKGIVEDSQSLLGLF